ncbi:hypothetical protein [Streptomyces zingiberis]|uniref:Uncharacterized protein n=1 Tax=Streptomyces zingiberis TaxID=2053010 RepID=A0ABX1BZH4_9ACTN|nr:hypothetical protein [Streptomyces zingiberis]NJQ01901.1 hypothetical protein [Streptomyces zingiberis]
MVARRSIGTVRSWAESVLRGLGPPAGHTLAVSAAPPEEPNPPGSGRPGGRFGPGEELGPGEPAGPSPSPAYRSHLWLDGDAGGTPAGAEPGGPGAAPPEREAGAPTGGGPSGVLVTLGFADGSAVGVRVDDALDDAQALALLAGQLQDGVVEAAGGAPLPPCPEPGHGHPAAVDVVDGTASWVCPTTGTARPVLGPEAG